MLLRRIARPLFASWFVAEAVVAGVVGVGLGEAVIGGVVGRVAK